MIINVKAQSIEVPLQQFVSKTENVYSCAFTFSDEWAEYSKTAVFKIKDGQAYEKVLLSADPTTTMPTEVLAHAGLIQIGVYGTHGTKVYPTVWSDYIYITPGTTEGITPATPTQSVYDQILALLNGFSATVSKTGSVATITIVDPNGTHTCTISDGQDGQDGADGEDGEDGFSPVCTITEITGGHRLSITDAEGTETADIMDGEDGGDGDDGVGISSITYARESSEGKVYTVTMTDGTTYEITAPKGSDASVTAENIRTALGYTPADDSDVTAIEQKIPSQATSSNQLADKNFVNSAISGHHDSAKQDVISDLESIRSGASLGATALQSVPNTYRTSADQDVIDGGKVDKVSGKGLSTEDYTSAEKTKLADITTETWTFTLSDSTTVAKSVKVGV